MADRVIRFFVSSSMSELPDERQAIKRAIEGLEFGTFLYEDNANAGVEPPKEQWEKELAATNVVIVILYRKLGKWTMAEIDFADKAKTPVLYYRKKDPEKQPAPELVEFLEVIEDVEKGKSVRYFAEAAELETIVPKDVNDLLAGLLERLSKFEKGEIAGPRRQGTEGDDGVEVDEVARPGVRSKASPRRVAKHDGVFVGRTDAVEGVAEGLTAGERLLAVTGGYGIGRKTLMRHLSYDEAFATATGIRPDRVGVSPIHGGTAELEDMLQALWDTFYEVEPDATAVTVVDPIKRQGDLEKPKALVVIEDAGLSETDLGTVAEQMRDSKLIVTTDADWYGEEVALEGLDAAQDMLTIFRSGYRNPVPAAANEALGALFRRVGGSPFLVDALAKRARKDVGKQGADKAALVAWAQTLAAVDDDAFQKALVPEKARIAFDAVRAAGTVVPLDVARRMPGVQDAAIAGLDEEALQAASPRLRANPALAAAAGRPQDDDALLAPMFDAALAWAAEATSDEIFENREFVLRMLDWGAGQGRNADVIRLARSTEHAMAVGGRHGAWRRVLTAALDAARSGDQPDRETEAWALHQLGSMALLRDELDDAREILHDALERREALGDKAAAEVTRHNLGLIPMAIVSVATLVLLLLGIAGWFAASTAFADSWTRVPASDGDGDGTTPTTTTTPITTTQPGSTTSTTGGPSTTAASAEVLVLDVSATPTQVVAGGVVGLSVTVTNTSGAPFTLTDLAVTLAGPAEALAGDVCDDALVTLAANDTVTCTVQTAVGGAPGDEVSFTVTAEAAEEESGRTVVQSATVAVPIVAPLSVTLSALPARVQPGGSVDFTVGAIAATDVTVVAVTADGGGVADVSAVSGCDTGVLTVPGSAGYRCAFAGTVDGNPGDTAVVTVDVRYVLPDGTELVSTGAADLELIAPETASVSVSAEWTVSFDADGDGFADAGDEVTFDYTIGNGGGVRLSGISVSDSLSGTVLAPFESLDPGRSAALSSVHRVTQAEFDAWSLVNTVTVTASAEGSDVAPASDTVVVRLAPQEPALVADIVAGIAAGDISYSPTLENTGNVTLSAVRLTSERAPGLLCELGDLAPGTPVSCPTKTYAPSAADLGAARITDAATIRATSPLGVGIEADTTIEVTFGVLEVAVDVVTVPSGPTFDVVFADQEWQMAAGAVEISAVAGTNGPETVTVWLPDDWTLGGASCASIAPVAGPGVGTVDVAVAPGSVSQCTLEISGAGVIEIDPNVLRFPPDTFTITNVGTATVEVPPYSPSPAAGFTTSDDCDVPLVPGASCTVAVAADPGTIGIIDFDFGPGVSGDTRVLLIGP